MRGPLAIFAAALLIGATVLVAAPVSAHSVLVDSTPAEGETLTELPEAFSVTANETLLDLGGQGVFLLQIRDAAGAYYGDGCVEVVDATMSAPAVIGASGKYTMIWRIVSADGHPVSGEVDFTWQAPEGFEPAEGSADAPRCGGPEEPETSPTDGEVALGIAIALALAAVAAAVIVAATRRKRTT
ncbi:MAG TPA: copper resistance protein CopC [Pseudolysinimonas sp.]|nr:copper resistance protein CopC [Pseudolysinimonas sp.]